MLTVNEVANKLRVTPRTIYRWIKAGKLDAIKLGGVVRIEEDAYNRFIAHKA